MKIELIAGLVLVAACSASDTLAPVTPIIETDRELDLG
jgi:hypothetical protein